MHTHTTAKWVLSQENKAIPVFENQCLKHLSLGFKKHKTVFLNCFFNVSFWDRVSYWTCWLARLADPGAVSTSPALGVVRDTHHFYSLYSLNSGPTFVQQAHHWPSYLPRLLVWLSENLRSCCFCLLEAGRAQEVLQVCVHLDSQTVCLPEHSPHGLPALFLRLLLPEPTETVLSTGTLPIYRKQVIQGAAFLGLPSLTQHHDPGSPPVCKTSPWLSVFVCVCFEIWLHVDWPKAHYLSEDTLELLLILPPSPQHWDHRHAPLYSYVRCRG